LIHFICACPQRIAWMLLPVSAAVFSAGLITSAAATADPGKQTRITKWVDRDGGVHYGDQPPPWADATPVKVRPNVIDTNSYGVPVHLRERPATRQQPARQPAKAQMTGRADLRAYVEHCRQNRGVDCEWEARAMIDGPATVLFPGDPYIFRRPDVKPPPPGLPLKFSIRP